MYEIKKITIKDYVTYENATLNLVDSPLIVIRGKNFDRPEKGSTNGAGKSVLLSAIPKIRYNSMPSPVKTRKDLKEGLKATSHLKMDIVSNGVKYTIRQFVKGGAVKLSIYEGNTKKKYRLKSDVEKLLAKIMPKTEDQFYAIEYIDAKRPPLLQYGTDAQRFAFFEQFFNLNLYDALSAKVNKEHTKLKLQVQEIEILDREIREREKSNPGGSPKKLLRQKEELLEETGKIRDKVTNLFSELQSIRTFLTLSEGINLKSSLDDLKAKIKRGKELEEKLDKYLRKSVRIKEQTKAFERYNEKIAKINSELSELKDVQIDKGIVQEIQELESRLTNLLETKSVIKDLMESIADLEEQLKAINIKEHIEYAKKTPTEKVRDELNRYKHKASDIEEMLTNLKEHMDKHDGNPDCPVCGTILDAKFLDQLLKGKKKELEESGLQIKKLKSVLEWQAIRTSLKAQEKELDGRTLDDINSNIKKLRSKIETKQEEYAQMKRKAKLKTELKAIPEVEKPPELTIDVEEITRQLEEVREKIARFRSTLEKRRKLEELDIKYTSREEAEEKQREIQMLLNKYRPTLDRLQVMLDQISTKAAKASTVADDIRRLSKDINELKNETQDFRIYEALRKAFGARGLRKIRVMEIAKAFESTLNEYAPFIYDEKITFTLNVTETKFQILASRNKGTGDVRRLSGAESRSFTMLSILALLRFVPNSARSNLLVLDEMEANMDEPSRKLLVEKFIPKLNEYAKNIVLITPKSEKEFHVPRAKNYIVEKKGGISQLRLVA